MKEKVCCFTGHRPQKLPYGFNEEDVRCVKLKKRLRKEIVKLIKKHNVTRFISGMALGVDIYSAEIVLSLRKKYPHIILECAIPCETQCIKWSESMRDRYYDIISRCDEETLIQKRYTHDCMQKRNEYMIDKSDFVIAVWDGRPSGTGNTVRYAENEGKEIIRIDP